MGKRKVDILAAQLTPILQELVNLCQAKGHTVELEIGQEWTLEIGGDGRVQEIWKSSEDQWMDSGCTF